MSLFFKKILFLLPILLFVLWLNYSEDPAHLFTNDYELGIAKLLLSGKNVTDIENYDERLLQKFYIQGTLQPKDIIVLGSSRSMQISSDLFQSYTFFNHSVSGASIEDYIAIYQMYYQSGFRPKIVILGVDPWILNKNNFQGRWQSLAQEYYAGSKRIGLTEPIAIPIFEFDKYKELFSPAYFQESFKYYLLRLENDNYSRKYYVTENLDGKENIKHFDGSLSYNQKFSEMNQSDVLDSAKEYVSANPVYSLGQFDRLDPELKFKFELFVSSLIHEDIQVVLFLPPYHPYVYNQLSESQKYGIITTVEDYFTKIAVKNNIPLLGSYNPYNIFCAENQFYDGMHPKRECLKNIFDKYTH